MCGDAASRSQLKRMPARGDDPRVSSAGEGEQRRRRKWPGRLGRCGGGGHERSRALPTDAQAGTPLWLLTLWNVGAGALHGVVKGSRSLRRLDACRGVYVHGSQRDVISSNLITTHLHTYTDTEHRDGTREVIAPSPRLVRTPRRRSRELYVHHRFDTSRQAWAKASVPYSRHSCTLAFTGARTQNT